MKQFLFISILLLSFASCNKNKTKKDPLVGEVAFLVGSWEWILTTETYDFCNSQISEVDSILAPSIEDSYRLNFIEEGIIEYYKNEVLLDEQHVSLGEVIVNDSIVFLDIYPDENSDLRLSCVWDENRLSMNRFPFVSDSDGCLWRLNYFTKE
jgi:hypothetical protein